MWSGAQMPAQIKLKIYNSFPAWSEQLPPEIGFGCSSSSFLESTDTESTASLMGCWFHMYCLNWKPLHNTATSDKRWPDLWLCFILKWYEPPLNFEVATANSYHRHHLFLLSPPLPITVNPLSHLLDLILQIFYHSEDQDLFATPDPKNSSSNY